MVTCVNSEREKRGLVVQTSLGFQILQYEFLGPVSLDEWGPPMEKLVYLILSRSKDDKFTLLYVDDCTKTDDKSFFVQHPSFKCWVQHAGSDRSLYVAILPMFESGEDARLAVSGKIVAFYKPPCNPDTGKRQPDYAVRRQGDLSAPPTSKPPTKPTTSESFNCPCCGSEMKPDQILEKTTVFRCGGCGISDTRLNP